MNEISIKIPSITENIRIVESFIDQAKDEFSLTDDIYGNILIAVTEAVNNAIIHGNGQDKGKDIELTVLKDKHSIHFTVQDQGKGFDWKSLKDPTEPAYIEEIGGRGIFLIRNLADDCTFSDKGRKLKMDFYV
jgi:serine/threonine-protein kinase RsbW